MLSRNVGKQLPIYIVQHPKRAKDSAMRAGGNLRKRPVVINIKLAPSILPKLK
jgi:hypothetical protein